MPTNQVWTDKPIDACNGTHGGKNDVCKTCALNISNFNPEFEGTKHAPQGKYKFVKMEICTLVRPYWSQYRSNQNLQ